MDTSLERIAFDMIKELGFVKSQNIVIKKDAMIEEIDRVIELYQYALEKIKPAQNTNPKA